MSREGRPRTFFFLFFYSFLSAYEFLGMSVSLTVENPDKNEITIRGAVSS